MRSVWRALRPGGRLLLTVPVGPDALVWNLHRRYGPARLPLLLQGWEEVERFGWEEARLTAPASTRRSYEPLFLLRRNGSEVDDIWNANKNEIVKEGGQHGGNALLEDGLVPEGGRTDDRQASRVSSDSSHEEL